MAKKFSHIISVSKDLDGNVEIVSKVKKELNPVELNTDTPEGINKVDFKSEEFNLFEKAEEIFDRKY